MDQALRKQWTMAEQDQRISEAIDRERNRLRNFIRRRVPDQEDAEDVLQDVFYELVEAYRLMKPVEQATAWLFRVARNRIIDLFRKRRREAMRNVPPTITEDGERLPLEDLLPSPDAGPDQAYVRSVLLEEIDAALDEANTTRLSTVLREFLDRSQFIIITHKKRTMAAADVLYGITMQESGVSKQVAVRFEDWPEDETEQEAEQKVA